MAVRGPEERQLLAMLESPSDQRRLREVVSGRMSTGRLGDLRISRLIAGGNIISGWCHQRDLLYVSTLAGHYLTEEKQFDTLEIMEEHGINTISPDVSQMDIINKYKRERGGGIQTIVGVREDWEYLDNPSWNRFKEWIDRSVDDGASTLYTQGGYTERLLRTGDPERLEILARAIDYIKSQGVPAGLGGHDIKVIEIAEANGIEPDYYFKTFHHDRYWSAHPRETREPWSVDSTRYVDHDKFHDNIYDLFPEKTAAVMARKNKPWIAFKTLAAGAIRPPEAFEFCFRGGADFLSVGMFDFQVGENCVTANEVLDTPEVRNRPRPWCG